MDDEKLMAALTKLSSQIADVKDELAEFRGEFNAFRSEVNAFRLDVGAQFANVDSQLTLIRDDIHVNMASADIALDRSRSTRDEVTNLQTQISALHRNQMRLTERVAKLEQPDKTERP